MGKKKGPFFEIETRNPSVHYKSMPFTMSDVMSSFTISSVGAVKQTFKFLTCLMEKFNLYLL